VSILTPSPNGVNWKRKISAQLSLTSASLSYQAAMVEPVQAMRNTEKEQTPTPPLHKSISPNHTPKTQTPYTARNSNPTPKTPWPKKYKINQL
jgi:hypothetical protein